jgi:hypothetical protein
MSMRFAPMALIAAAPFAGNAAAQDAMPPSTEAIARTIGLCTIRAANLAEQLDAANAQVKALQAELEQLKKPVTVPNK